MGMILVGEVLPLKQKQKLTPPQPSPSLREREGAEATPPQPSPSLREREGADHACCEIAVLPRVSLPLAAGQGEGWGGVLLLYRF